MKIGEAQKMYSAKLNELWNRKLELTKQQKEHQKSPNYKEDAGVSLELSMVEEEYEKARDFMEDFMTYKTAMHNAIVTRQQGDAMEEAAEDLAKYMEIARRISNGDKVPASDEQKLLKYNYKLYMAAKNMAVMNENKPHKKYDSLWDEDEEKRPEETPDASETVNDMECALKMPDVSIPNGSAEDVS